MTEGNVDECSAFPRLELMASVKLVTQFWKQSTIENKIKEAFHESLVLVSLSDRKKEDIIADVFADVIMKMESLFKRLPKLLIMKILDVTVLIGNEIFNWVYIQNYKFSKVFIRLFTGVVEINFVDHLDCLILSPFGIIDFKQTAKMLCYNSQLTDILKYILACNYCLVDEIALISSSTDVLWLLKQECSFLINVVETYPMVALFTNELSYLLSRLQVHPSIERYFLECSTDSERVFIMLTSPREDDTAYDKIMYSFSSSADVPIQYLWNNFNQPTKIKYSYAFFSYSPNSALTMCFMLSQMNNEQIKNDKICQYFNHLLFECSFLISFKYFLQNCNRNTYLIILEELIHLMRNKCNDSCSCYSRTKLINKVVHTLLISNAFKFSDDQKQYLDEYCNFRCSKYKIMFTELWKVTPDYTRKDILKICGIHLSITSVIPKLCDWVFKLLKTDHVDIMSLLLNSFTNEEKIALVHNRAVYNNCADFVLNGDYILLDKFLSIYFDLQEDEINTFKKKCFSFTLNYIVTICTGQDVRILNEFSNYLSSFLSVEDISKCKQNLLSEGDLIFQLLFNNCYNIDNNTLDFQKIDNFLKWCFSLEDDNAFELFKLNIFKTYQCGTYFVEFICDHFKAAHRDQKDYGLIDQIFNWCTSNDPNKLAQVKSDFYKSDSHKRTRRRGVPDLVRSLAQNDDNLDSLKKFIDWCFSSENSIESRTRKFSSDILAIDNNLTYVLSHVISHKGYTEADEILQWYCNTFQFDINARKRELLLNSNFLAQILYLIPSHVKVHASRLIILPKNVDEEKRVLKTIKWFNPSDQTIEHLRMKFSRSSWFEKYKIEHNLNCFIQERD